MELDPNAIRKAADALAEQGSAAIQAALSHHCAGCGGPKRVRRVLCDGCFRDVPPAVRSALAESPGDPSGPMAFVVGYLRAVADAAEAVRSARAAERDRAQGRLFTAGVSGGE